MAEEEQLLLESTAPAGSPTSDASSVTGHMAALQVNMPPHEATEDSDTEVLPARPLVRTHGRSGFDE